MGINELFDGIAKVVEQFAEELAACIPGICNDEISIKP